MEMHADDDFTMSFEYASAATAERFQNPLWLITELILGSRMRKSVALVKSYGRSIVANAMKDRQLAKDSGSHGTRKSLDAISGSLVQSLLDALGDLEIVSDAALNYLSAGRDTTAQALTWAFYLLMKHPHVAGNIISEVQTVLAENHEITDHKEPDPTIFTPVTMPYTMAVFYESLRLYPPIPFEIKQAEQETVLPDGTRLPKGSVVVWCPWAMNRSKITWGEDADVFRPERWLVHGKLVSKSASEFPVFNGGQRTCLGKRMAELIAVQVMATMTWMFEYQLVSEEKRVSKTSLTLPMEGGLPCHVKQRR
jgi:cytochrome P450